MNSRILMVLLIVAFLPLVSCSPEKRAKSLEADIIDILQEIKIVKGKLSEGRSKQGIIKTLVWDSKEVDKLEDKVDRLTEKFMTKRDKLLKILDEHPELEAQLNSELVSKLKWYRAKKITKDILLMIAVGILETY